MCCPPGRPGPIGPRASRSRAPCVARGRSVALFYSCSDAFVSARVHKERPLRILAIEDDHDTREMYARMLRDEGHEAILAADGVEGLQLLDPKPDLVILDLALPGLDGYDILRAMKADPTLSAIPILVVSASRFELPAGVDGFVAALRKPFDLPLLPAMLSLVGS
ncbi:MAG TPA: response regulator [Candidatus Limnocylindria bacterium]|nr:response regulator [Candidatus Limnocylindria bacterium]